ncbi:unnamed protein product [Polarella glacialis]|uniref:Uncharacterized protein n=1 Tax=Polarella glacialis TaxID=89957 RepID=A0A813D6E5_POLGL|nr:unnamed protein product [Polarella glacialis]
MSALRTLNTWGIYFFARFLNPCRVPNFSVRRTRTTLGGADWPCLASFNQQALHRVLPCCPVVEMWCLSVIRGLEVLHNLLCFLAIMLLTVIVAFLLLFND